MEYLIIEGVDSMLVFISFFVILWLYFFLGPAIVILVDRLPVPGAMRHAHGLSFFVFIMIANSEYPMEEVLRHELTHYRQMARYSPLLFPFMYLAANAIANRSGFKGILKYTLENKFEKEAIRAMNSTKPLPRVITINVRRSGTIKG